MADEWLERPTMTDLSVRVDVSCPDHEASRHLAGFIDQHAGAAGEVAVTLALARKIFATSRTPLERRVDATLSALPSKGNSGQTYSVDLTHKAGSISPFFSGTLAIHLSVRDDCIGLILAGQYDARMVTVSPLWDRASGHRIALAAAADLLRTISAYIELASARNEAARAGMRYRRPRRVESALDAEPIVVFPEAGGDVATLLQCVTRSHSIDRGR